MNYTIKISEPNLGRVLTFKAPTADDAVRLARSWLSEPVAVKAPTVGELIRDSKPKPPTQGIVAQGFEAFGAMGAGVPRERQ